MPIITVAELETKLYAEVITEITRGDIAIAETAIVAAVQECKMYLSRYDLVQLFGTDTEPPIVDDEYLKSIVKDIACWHLLRLSNTGVDYTTSRTAYTDALDVLKSIKAGAVQPQGWPYKTADTDHTMPDGNSINWNSNPKRSNHY
jgi:hypothetical protein